MGTWKTKIEMGGSAQTHKWAYLMDCMSNKAEGVSSTLLRQFPYTPDAS